MIQNLEILYSKQKILIMLTTCKLSNKTNSFNIVKMFLEKSITVSIEPVREP